MRHDHPFRTLAVVASAAIAWSAPALAQEERSTAEIEALYKARTDSALMRFSEADVRFMTGMIHHHAQALVMADFAPTHGASATIQTLAARIINAQKDEIATMETWLRDRGQPVPEVHVEAAAAAAEDGDGHAMHGDHMPDGAGHDSAAAGCPMMHGAAHDSADHLMPGMLTPEQMEELDAARGAEFDRLFLTYMIQHHEGAVTMVDELFSTDGAAQDPLTFKLASDVQADQRTEIDRMEKMLSAPPAEGGAR